MSLGNGLGRLAGRVIRIGHLGTFTELTLPATLAGVELGLVIAAAPRRSGSVQAAMEFIADDASAVEEVGVVKIRWISARSRFLSRHQKISARCRCLPIPVRNAGWSLHGAKRAALPEGVAAPNCA